MNFLLDTNVVSEWVKLRPNLGVMEWMAAADEDRLFLSVITLAELRYGVERLTAGRKKDRLGEWLEQELMERFAGRILVVNDQVAGKWGGLQAQSEVAGRPLGIMDGFLAATTAVHGMTIVTRDSGGFAAAGCRVFNPWWNEEGHARVFGATENHTGLLK